MKIGLVRFSSLGDVLLTTGVIRELKRRLPDTQITMITSSRYSDIFAFNPNLDNLIVLEGKRPGDLLRLAKRVRNEAFDIIADLHLNLRSLFVSLSSKSRGRLHYSKCRWPRSMMVFRKERRRLDHVVTRYFRPFEELGLKLTNPRPEIWIDDATKRRMDFFLGNPRIPLVAISPGARRPTKRWIAEGYGELCKLLIELEGARVVLVGDTDDTRVASRVKGIVGRELIDLTGKTSLLELASVLARCSAVVTNDSGPMHMAAAVNTPIVAIFGPTVPEFGFSPLGKAEVIQKELPCRPCSLHGSERCTKNGFKCMRLITADEVFHVVSGVLNDR